MEAREVLSNAKNDTRRKIENTYERYGTRRLDTRGDHKMDDRNSRLQKRC